MVVDEAGVPVSAEGRDRSDADAFPDSIRRNLDGGEPPTLRERAGAAMHLLRTRDGWSDGCVAEACGLSARTVGCLRLRMLVRGELRPCLPRRASG